MREVHSSVDGMSTGSRYKFSINVGDITYVEYLVTVSVRVLQNLIKFSEFQKTYRMSRFL